MPKRTLGYGRLDALLGFHLRMASAALARDFMSAMSELDLTQKQYAVLELVAANSGVPQSDVAQMLATDRATLMAVIDKVEVRELVQRRQSRRDGRTNELSLTAEGRVLLRQARHRIALHERKFRLGLGATESLMLIGLLRKVETIAMRNQGPARGVEPPLLRRRSTFGRPAEID